MKQETLAKICKTGEAGLPEWRAHARCLASADTSASPYLRDDLQAVFGKAAVRKARRRFDLLDLRQRVSEALASPERAAHILSKIDDPAACRQFSLRHLFPLGTEETKELKEDCERLGFTFKGQKITGYTLPNKGQQP